VAIFEELSVLSISPKELLN